MRFCIYCGQKLNGDEIVCPNPECGRPVPGKIKINPVVKSDTDPIEPVGEFRKEEDKKPTYFKYAVLVCVVICVISISIVVGKINDKSPDTSILNENSGEAITDGNEKVKEEINETEDINSATLEEEKSLSEDFNDSVTEESMSSSIMLVKDVTGTLNMRAEAMHNSALAGTVESVDTIMYYNGISAEGLGSDNQNHTWYYVKTESGVEGWVRSDLVKIKENNGNSPFYGIWCAASVNETEMRKVVAELVSQGFDAKVFLTTEWDNLNNESWYVVTAGVYASEEAANAELANVQEAGYPNAYVKYSGERR